MCSARCCSESAPFALRRCLAAALSFLTRIDECCDANFHVSTRSAGGSERERNVEMCAEIRVFQWMGQLGGRSAARGGGHSPFTSQVEQGQSSTVLNVNGRSSSSFCCAFYAVTVSDRSVEGRSCY